MAEAVETTDEVATDEVETEEVENEQEEAADPSEKLKKALQAERKARRDAEKRAREATDALAAKDKPADEQAIELARREAAAEATRTVSGRIVRAEIKAALSGKVADPTRVLGLIDTSDIEVGDDGEVDETAVADAIDAFLTTYPEFKAGRSSGSADQFSRGRQPAKPEKPNPNDLIRAAFKKD